MKSDRFTESIRRRLESIRPDFTERDWTRLHGSLRQAGLSDPADLPTSGAGSWQTWLLAAAGLGVVVLLALTGWQHHEISQLRRALAETTGQLNQSVTAKATETAAATSSPRSDTVYLTRYVRLPATPRTDFAARPLNAADLRPEENRPAASHLPVDSSARIVRDNVAARAVEQIGDAPAQPIVSSLGAPDLPKKQRSRWPPAGPEPPGDEKGIDLTLTQRETTGTGPVSSQPTPARVNPQPADYSAGTDPVTASLPDQLNPLTITQVLPAPVDWNARLVRKLRRTSLPAPAGLAQLQRLASESISRSVVRVRLGGGADVLARGWNAGAIIELLTDRHWAISAGLVRASQLLGSYLTDDDYDFQTQQSFRRAFAPTSDPRRDIYGIGIHSIRYQIPVTVGYRIGLGRSLSLTPSLGTYLDLSNTMQVSFSYRKPLRQGFDQVDLQNNRPCDLVNSYTAGASLEWTQKRWVVQGGLLYTNTFFTDPTWFNQPTPGGRLRLLYQF